MRKIKDISLKAAEFIFSIPLQHFAMKFLYLLSERLYAENIPSVKDLQPRGFMLTSALKFNSS